MEATKPSQEDTIVAIATPPGDSGLAVLRLSGNQAFQLVDQCFTPVGKNARRPSESTSHTVHYGLIQDNDRVLDEVMVSVFEPPRTFTREPVVEISTHGGSLPAKMVLDHLLCLGARLAEPGEFTLRAFLNGRIDLTQAEAVADIIHARTEKAAHVAQEQLKGSLSHQVRNIRDDLMQMLAHLEAHIDFPDEDISPDTNRQLLTRLEDGKKTMQALLRTAKEGQLLRHGLRLAIIGKPNAGKSSLLNRLLDKERAIVSPQPGTTRDTIEAAANIRGIPVVIIDTAGLRHTDDTIEKEGVERSKQTAAEADLVIHLIDSSQPIEKDEMAWADDTHSRKILMALNKMDLPRHRSVSTTKTVLKVSCVSGEGIETLKDAILEAVWSGATPTESHEVMINSRHEDALLRCMESMLEVQEGLQVERELELIAMDLRLALSALGEVVGETTTENLLDAIFSQFCLGK